MDVTYEGPANITFIRVRYGTERLLGGSAEDQTRNLSIRYLQFGQFDIVGIFAGNRMNDLRVALHVKRIL